MKLRKVYAAVTAAVCSLTTLTYMPSVIMPTYASEIVHDDFEVNYDGWHGSSEEVSLDAFAGIGVNGSRGMLVSGRNSASDGASSSKGLYLGGGVEYTYNFNVFSDTDSRFTVNLTFLDEDENSTTVELISENVKGGEWTKLTAEYEAPENTSEYRIDITNDNTDDFRIDDITVTGEKSADQLVSAAGEGLVGKFGGYFRVGNILNGGTVNISGITANILKDCNAVECENETKPDATINRSQSSNNIGVNLNSCAAICDFASKNHLGFRGHTMVWHSQTPTWFFKDNFQDGGNWVSESVMNQRLESYIKNMFAAYKQQYPSLDLYAYDVCNECMSDDQSRCQNNGGARVPGVNNNNGNSPWVQVYGSNKFMDKAFEYARKYAPSTCKLFYNDYNEYMGWKMDKIYEKCKELYGKGLLDGVGMQSHVPANATGFAGTVDYLAAMDKYLSIGCDVQVTELDISVESGKYSYSQQADKYEAIFKHAMDYNNSGKKNKVSLVQIWGPNDANSWLKSGSNALLYDANNQPKEAYKRLMAMQTDGKTYDPGTPDPGTELKPNDYGWWYQCGFENGTDDWTGRGAAAVTSSGDHHYTEWGSKSLYVSGRTDSWNGAQYSLSSAIFKPGETYSFSSHVTYDTGNDTDIFYMKLQYKGSDGETHYDTIAEGTGVKGKWLQLVNTEYKIPSDASDMAIYIETKESTIDFYVDEAIGAVGGTGIAGEGQPEVPGDDPGTDPGVTYSLGDVNGDGTVNVADYLISKAALKIGFTDSAIKKAADVDRSTKFDENDVKLIWQFITKKITEFPQAEIDYGDFNISELQNKFGNVTIASSWKNDGENNPMTTQRFGADPGWMVYKDRLYIYTTNDAFEYPNGVLTENSYNSGTINCVSTSDMVNWTDHGAIPVAGRDGFNGPAKWANRAWAPDAEWKTINGKDKFFLYFANSGGGIGVLTADSPTGPWTDPLGHALLDWNTPGNSGVVWMFDPGVYLDHNTGEAYIAFGGGVDGKDKSNPGTGRIAKLGDDMISIVGSTVQMPTPYLFEDSSLIKIGDTWYYSYCTNWNVPRGTSINGTSFGSGEICYMTSKTPTVSNSWQFAGKVLPGTATNGVDKGGNNHHSVIYFKNKYYVAYHTRAQALRMGKTFKTSNGTSQDGNYRSTHISEASFSNGKVTCNVDLKGTSQIEALDPYAKQQAETMYNQSNDITVTGLQDTVVNAKKGSWIKTTGVDFKSGASTVTVKASSKNGAVIKICTNKDKSDAMTYVEIPAGGKMTEVTVPVVNSPSGKNDLFFVFNNDVTMDSWQFA